MNKTIFYQQDDGGISKRSYVVQVNNTSCEVLRIEDVTDTSVGFTMFAVILVLVFVIGFIARGSLDK